MKIKSKAKYWYIFSISFILLLGLGLLVIEFNKNMTYELIEKKSSLKNQIVKIKPSHGSCYIELEDGRKVLIPQSKNYDYSPVGICEIASVGDSIIKYINNDTMHLIKGNNKYVFKTGSALNLPD